MKYCAWIRAESYLPLSFIARQRQNFLYFAALIYWHEPKLLICALKPRPRTLFSSVIDYLLDKLRGIPDLRVKECQYSETRSFSLILKFCSAENISCARRKYFAKSIFALKNFSLLIRAKAPLIQQEFWRF
jgi:hypothetical protein